MLTTTNLPCVQGSESEFCPYSGDVGDQFSANLDSSEAEYIFFGYTVEQFQTALRRDWCFYLDSAQHPAHRPVLCPWSELTLLANRLSDGPSCSP
jgi:hypothetical protein